MLIYSIELFCSSHFLGITGLSLGYWCCSQLCWSGSGVRVWPAFSAFSCYLCSVFTSNSFLAQISGVSWGFVYTLVHFSNFSRAHSTERIPKFSANFLHPLTKQVAFKWLICNQGHIYIFLLGRCYIAILLIEEGPAELSVTLFRRMFVYPLFGTISWWLILYY